MKVVFLFIIPVIISVTLLLGLYIVSSSKPEVSALQVTSTPQAEVFLDDKLLGKTPFSNDKLKPGEYRLKLVAKEVSALSSFEEKITLREGILTVVDRVFKGSEVESEVVILSLEPLRDRKAVEIAVVSSPQSSEVKFDEEEQGVTPILLKDVTVSDHQITLIKEGYTSKTIRVAAKEGYRLTVSSKLSVLATEPSPTPSPLEEEQSQTIHILNTPTGFLRVREGPSTKSRELGRVNPGETFALLEEQEGWYRIKFEGEEDGWITNRYAKKE